MTRAKRSRLDFLKRLQAACPIRIRTILTDNGAQFTDRFTSRQIQAYNHFIPQQAIGHRFPIEALASWYDQHPELFIAPVMMQDYNQAERDNQIVTAWRSIHMGHRLSRIITRTGDAGMTGLGDGSRVAKTSLRIQAIGDVDELNSVLGLLLAEPDLPEAARDALLGVQHDLFDLGGELCVPGAEVMGVSQVERLEDFSERFNANLPRLEEFILPGGHRAAALAHLARAICRRAERAIARLGETESVRVETRRYINRLSDLLFILGRFLNHMAGREDVLWRRGDRASGEASDKA
jgi:cob(I)alamin adenosyltransferase